MKQAIPKLGVIALIVAALVVAGCSTDPPGSDDGTDGGVGDVSGPADDADDGPTDGGGSDSDRDAEPASDVEATDGTASDGTASDGTTSDGTDDGDAGDESPDGEDTTDADSGPQTFPDVSVEIDPQVSAGDQHNCVLDSEGKVCCWNGNSDETSDPAGTFTQIASGNYHNCAIRAANSEIHCWGDDTFESALEPPDGKFVEVDVGSQFSCGLRENGDVECWGNIETADVPSAPGYQNIAAAWSFACGVTTGGTIKCWSADGDPSEDWDVDVPTGDGFEVVSAGWSHACATNVGGAECWGDNFGGEPQEATDNRSGQFDDLAAGGNFSCARTFNGTLDCWGDDKFSRVSDAPSGAFDDVALGQTHGCAMKEDGTLECWAGNEPNSSDKPLFADESEFTEEDCEN